LSPSVCNLDNIQTLKVPTTALLLKVLQDLLPRLIESNIQAADKKPVKLIVIDSIADLFLSLDKTSSATLAERSKSLAEISTALHGIARKHQISVIVLNKTSDVFHWWTENADLGAPGDLVYHDQSRWFGRADSIHEERQKEASLGLVWANQVNVRIMFTRTSRRKHVDEISGPRATKRPRIEQLSQTKETSASVEQETTLLRRLSVVFSSVSVPNSIDFIISEQGISAPMDLQTVITPPYTAPAAATTAFVQKGFDGIAPLDVGAADTASESLSAQEAEDDGSEWDTLWKEDDEFYQNLDLHA
jgi:DNA repair protein RAD57